MTDIANERAIIAAMVYDASCTERGLIDLEIDDFANTNCRRLFASMQFLKSTDIPIDLVSVAGMYSSEADMVVMVTSEFYLASNMQSYIAKLKQDRKMRDFISGMSKCLQKANDEDPQCFEEAQHLLDELNTIGCATINPVCDKVDEALNDIGEVKSGILTGFTRLDTCTHGLAKGGLYIVAGRPGMGKSAFANNVAINVCRKNNNVAAVFSLEMDDKSLIQRMIYSISRVANDAVRNKTAKQSDIERMIDAAEQIKTFKMFIDEKYAVTTQRIKSACYKIKQQEKRLDLVIVDYLQLMKTNQKKNSNREQEVGELTRDLKLMAMELDVPIIALAQLNRDCEKRPDKRPLLIDLRESGSIEQDADVVLFTYRDCVYNEMANEWEAEIIVAKNRNGVSGKTIDLNWHGEWFLFDNPATEQDMAGKPMDWNKI